MRAPGGGLMPDARVEKLAQTLVEYSVQVKPGDWVVIVSQPIAEPLVRAVLRHTLRAGGRPSVLLSTDSPAQVYYEEANEDQLKWLSPFERMPFEEADVLVNIQATENTRALTGADTSKMQMRSAARKGVMDAYMRRGASGELRWTLTQFPCLAYAQDADMSLSEFEDFVYRATFADQDDPVNLFKEGQVSKASAEKNEDYLIKMLDQDPGARIIGELGIGTNYSIDRFTKSILYDEKIGGTIHTAVGAGYPEVGGKNQSGVHWEMICDMRTDSEIRVEGDLFYKDGRFQV